MTDRGYIVAYLLVIFPVAYLLDTFKFTPFEAECAALIERSKHDDTKVPLLCTPMMKGK